MTHEFNIGDTVVRINSGFRDMRVGDTGEVVDFGDNFISLQGHTDGPKWIRFDPANFELAKPTNPAKAGTTDPNGIDQHAPGAKLDNGKPRHGLVLGAFAGALTEVAKVGTFGANKYSDNGWMSVPNGLARYTDAMLRHHFAEAGGEELDDDSGLRHAAHRAWNALAVLELALRDKREPSNADTTTS